MENLLFASRDAAVLSVVIGVVVLCCGKYIPAGWRHGLWLLVAVRLVMPVLPSSPVSWQRMLVMDEVPAVVSEVPLKTDEVMQVAELELPSPGEVGEFDFERMGAAASLSSEQSDAPEIVEDSGLGLWEVLFGVWLFGAAFFLCAGGFFSWRFWRRLESFLSQDGSEEGLGEFLEKLGGELGLKEFPAIRVTEAVEVPALFGVFRPKVLIPPSALKRLSEAELRLVLMHELGHWKRRDLWVNFLLVVLQAVHWFNPLVWWAFHRVRVESERATDAWVLKRAGADQARNYGEMLLRLLEGSTGAKTVFSGMVSVVESPKDLKRRMLGIVKFSGKRNRVAVLASVAVLVGLATVGLTKPPGDVVETEEEVEQSEAGFEKEAIEFRVVSDVGEPVEGAEVYLELRDVVADQVLEPLKLCGETDGEGAIDVVLGYDLDSLKWLRYRVFARHSEHGYAARSGEGLNKEFPGELRMAQGHSLNFRVIDTEGNPVVGMSLRVAQATIPEYSNSFPRKIPEYWTGVPFLPKGFWGGVTDSQGRCTILGLLDGIYYVDHNDPYFAQFPGAHHPKYQHKSPSEIDEIELIVRPACSVRGHVSLPGGTPIAGATVNILEHYHYTQGGCSYETVTDEKGSYVLSRLLPGDYDVRVSLSREMRKEWVADIKPVSLKSEEEIRDFDFILQKGGLVTGRITLADTGVAVSNYQMGATSTDSASPLHLWWNFTDAEGRFQYRLPAGSRKVYAAGREPEGYTTESEKDRGMSETFEVVEGGSYEANFELIREVKIEGVVLDESGQPVADVSIICFEPRDRMSNSFQLMSDKEGRFSLKLPAGVKVAHLVARSGPLMSPLEKCYPVGENVELRLREASLKTLTGKVVNEDGEPIKDASIVVESSLPRQYLYRSWMPGVILSDENGQFEFADVLPADSYTILVSKGGYGAKRATVASKLEKKLTFELVALPIAVGIVSGRVVDSSGNGVEGVGIDSGKIQSHLLGFSKRTDAKGYFKVGGLVEGWHDLRFKKATMDGQRTAFLRVKSGSKDVKVVLPEGLSNWKTQDGLVDLVGKLAPPLKARKWFHSDGLPERNLGKVRLISFVGMRSALSHFPNTLKKLQGFREENKDGDLEVIVVHGDWPEEEVREVLKSDFPDLKLPLAIEPENGAMSEAFGVDGTLTAVVDREGKVVFQDRKNWGKAKEKVLELLGKDLEE
ncbi:MAG: M56 family metallopeptidase [Luteolibacter sp.]